MNNKYQDELYEKLNRAFTKDTKENSRKEILKLVPGNNYLVRLIFNFAEPEKTFRHYYLHGWKSEVDGKYISSCCPTTYNEECPICREYFKLYNEGSDESREMAKLIKRKSRVYANVYVVDDPTTPENNNTVKILSYGQQLEDIINAAYDGVDKDEVGARMFDFSENGCNLRIKVDKNQGDFPVYSASRFLNPSAIAATQDQATEQAHDLDALIKIKSNADLLTMISVGLYAESADSTPAPAPSAPVAKAKPAPAKPVASKPTAAVVDEDAPLVDDGSGVTNEDDVLASLQEFIKE